ncbi:MAG: nucleoside triphosphate pyrophosphohydrolase, partial [Planctomycetota bacterium]|nr:nucleoside triphosphate pyrophosphohydrolase [Planctomycetota bacterium]
AKTELRPPEPVDANDPRVEAFRLLVGIVDRLREPDGCPWDKEQTLESMTPHLVEEAHELAEAIETDQDESVVGEAGDLLLNVLLVARIAQDDDRFDLTHVCEAICAKLIRRHPHVFGDAEAEDSAQVLNRWEQIKKAERTEADEDASALAGIPRGMPALLRAMRVSGKAVTAGFRWSDVSGSLDKLREELGELEAALPPEALSSLGSPDLDEEAWKSIDHELGDVLMAAAFLSSYLGRDPETLLKRALVRFDKRFRAMEADLDGNLQRDLSMLLAAWNQVKQRED